MLDGNTRQNTIQILKKYICPYKSNLQEEKIVLNNLKMLSSKLLFNVILFCVRFRLRCFAQWSLKQEEYGFNFAIYDS